MHFDLTLLAEGLALGLLGIGIAIVLFRAINSKSQVSQSARQQQLFDQRHTICQRDLPAYIEFRREEGTVEARKLYPTVAEHLAECEECAETFRLTTQLLDAADQGR